MLQTEFFELDFLLIDCPVLIFILSILFFGASESLSGEKCYIYLHLQTNNNNKNSRV